MSNLVETSKNYFNGEFINQASISLIESTSGITKVLSAIIPTSLLGALNHANSGADGANSIFSMAKKGAEDLAPTPNFHTLKLQENEGGNIFSQLFGSNQSEIITHISRFAGVKETTTKSLFNMGIPSIMGVLGKQAEQNNISNPSELANFLAGQKDEIQQAIPSGFSSITKTAAYGSTIGAGPKKPPFIETKARSTKWVIPLIVIIAALALIGYFMRNRNDVQERAVKTDTIKVVTPAVPAPVIIPSAPLKVKLPNGTLLDAYKGGIEDQLVAFLNSNWKAMSDAQLKDKWFDFDKLNFETGKATLIAGSEKQLDNLAQILKAFPDAKLKIGGYTDALGDAKVNKSLSQDRANMVKTELEKRGVGMQIIGAEGYGSEFAKALATAPDEERALDRRISVSVRK